MTKTRLLRNRYRSTKSKIEDPSWPKFQHEKCYLKFMNVCLMTLNSSYFFVLKFTLTKH